MHHCFAFLSASAGLRQNSRKASFLKSFYSTIQLEPSQKRFQNKVALITASTDGIGFAIAQRLGLEGASVVISSRKAENVEKALHSLHKLQIKAIGLPCNVSSSQQRSELIQTAVQQFGPIDVLVSNAASSLFFGPVLETPDDQWRKMLENNLTSAFLLSKETMPHLSPRANILFVASIAAYESLPGLGCYSITKTALLALARSIAVECGPKGIRANCLAPGIIHTKFSKALTDDPHLCKLILKQVPSRRIGAPHECAATAAFLCSDDASYVNGECIVTAGGMRSRL